MHYAERAPSDELAPHVKCIWRFESAAPGKVDRIVPDGRPELIVHLGAPYEEITAAGTAIIQPLAFFAGQVTMPLRVRAMGNANVIGVRFHPHGARAFMGVPMRELTDRRVALEEFPGSAADPMKAVEDFVSARIRRLAVAADSVASAASRRIEAAAGAIDVADLVEEAGIGRRQLERRFADAVGIGPALLAAVFRFRSAFDLIERDGRRPWTDAALAAGFYDQSHFIREFRRFVGCTPTEFEAERSALASALVDA